MKMTVWKLVLVLTLSVPAWSQAADPVSLDQGFRNIPDTVRPWAYWWWVNGNVDEKTITRDLEAMKQAGFGGLLMFDARGYHDDHIGEVPTKMDFMSPEWRKMLKFSIEKASKLGLEVSVNLSSCAGALKGPWAVGDDAPKKLVWTVTEVKGPQFSCELKKPEGKRFWDIGVIAVRHDDAPAKSFDQWQDAAPKAGTQPVVTKVVDLTSRVDKQAKISWDVPKGRWTVLRFGYVTMEGHEYDVDILDPKAVEGHFNRMGKTIMEDVQPLVGKTLTHFYSVSWEGAAPTWTPALEKEFARYRGYVLREWLPVLAGFTVRTPEESARFMRDYYKTLGDCFRVNFYIKMADLCHAAGLKWHSESGGPWDRKIASFAEADQIAFLGCNDMPQGEFWFTGSPIKRRQDMNRPQAMAAHIYGRRLAASEAFTHMVRHWSAYPAVLKPFADSAFIDGVNQLVWHTFTASPAKFGKPGIEYFAGTHINPNVTWFPQARAFVDYLSRCQFMLRQGQPVVDVCVYIGDKPYLHWGRGTNWSERATLHLPKGLNYDLITTEVLMDKVYPSGGNLVYAHGMTNRFLVVDLDEETILPTALRRINSLRNNGISVVLGQRKPKCAPGLMNYPTSDKTVQQVADALWAKPLRIEEAMEARKLAPDFEGPFEYTHRQDGYTDIYFVSGQGTGECTFRVANKRPEFWDPVTGTMTSAAGWRTTFDDRTVVTLTLPENGSVFVVFRATDLQRQAAPPPPPAEMALNGSWQVQFETGHGAPASIEFEQLVAWDKHPEDAIKHFSGTATYRKTFELTAEQASRPVRLRLGEVKCIAEVSVNGKNLGVVWTDPWTVELTGAVKAGKNELKVAVTNTWVNRLIGDAGLPPKKRTTQTNVRFLPEPAKRSFMGFSSKDPLMTSGLLGPVRLEFPQ